ncbi:Unknown protein, partial [Striga hermonthica]
NLVRYPSAESATASHHGWDSSNSQSVLRVRAQNSTIGSAPAAHGRRSRAIATIHLPHRTDSTWHSEPSLALHLIELEILHCIVKPRVGVGSVNVESTSLGLSTRGWSWMFETCDRCSYSSFYSYPYSMWFRSYACLGFSRLGGGCNIPF